MINLYPSPYSTYDLVNAELEGLSDGTASLINDRNDILKYIDDASFILSESCNRVFVPYVKTDLKQGYDKRVGYTLRLPDDCLSLSSVSDYASTTIESTSYDLLDGAYEYNSMPYVYIDFATGSNIFVTRNSADLRTRFTFDGIWGYSKRSYANSWEAVSTLATAIDSTTATTIRVANAALFSIYDHIRIGTEFMRVTATDTTTSPDTLTVIRGINGTTAATALINASIERWIIDEQIQLATTRLAGWLYQNRKSGSTTLVFGDGTVQVNSVPSIVAQAIHARRKRPMIEVV